MQYRIKRMASRFEITLPDSSDRSRNAPPKNSGGEIVWDEDTKQYMWVPSVTRFDARDLRLIAKALRELGGK